MGNIQTIIWHSPRRLAPTRLPYDIWCLVFDEVFAIHEEEEDEDEDEEAYKEEDEQRDRDDYRGPSLFFRWLGKLRLTCKDFNTVIIPLVYHESFSLGTERSLQRLIDWPESFQIKTNLAKHVTLLGLPSSENKMFQAVTCSLILACEKCECIVWRVNEGKGQEFEQKEARIASQYLNAYTQRKRDLKRIRFVTWAHGYMIDELPLSLTKTGAEKPDATIAEARETTTPSEEVPEVYLDLLRLEISGDRSMTLIPGSQRLPPMKKLRLYQYSWTHSAEEVGRIFDFSMLRKLTLRTINVDLFLRSVEPRLLLHLEALKITSYDDNGDRSRRVSLRKNLAVLLGQLIHLNSLTLDFPGWKSVVTTEMMARWSPQLVRLQLNAGSQVRMMSPSQVRDDLKPCKKLQRVHLDLDMTTQNNNHLVLLTTLTELECLEILDLTVKGTFGVTGVASNSSDPDYDAAMVIMEKLHSKKVGVPFKALTMYGHSLSAPPGWQPPAGTYEWSTTRTFRSTFSSDTGKIESSGDPRIEPRPIVVGDDTEDDMWEDTDADSDSEGSADGVNESGSVDVDLPGVAEAMSSLSME